MVRQKLLWTLIVCLATGALPALAQKHHAKAAPGAPEVWTDPGDIRSRDLFYGPGGKEGQPQPPFRFEKEDKAGTSPKFDVIDGRDEKWKVKLGVEARPETAAARLLWAVGYFANTNYFVDDLRVVGMPAHVSRGTEFVDKQGEAFQARLQRKPGKDHQPWSWTKNPLRGTREFNGLRVMMALVHNWDLKDDNNARYQDKETGHEIYYVTDLGASFGTTGKSYSDKGSKNNFEAYRNAKFLSRVTPEYVSFNFPTHPALYHIFNLPYFIRGIRNRWIGRHIPRQDVKWIASLLAQLTPQQIQDAFRAAGYSPKQIEEFSHVLQSRITELSKL